MKLTILAIFLIVLNACSENSDKNVKLKGKHAQVILEYSNNFFLDDSLFNNLTSDKSIEEFTIEFLTEETRINETLKRLDYPGDKKSIDEIRKKIQLHSISNTNKVEINFYNDDENYSLIILNELMKVFLNDLAEYHMAKFVEYDDKIDQESRMIIDKLDKSSLFMNPTAIKYFLMAEDNNSMKKIITKADIIYKPLIDAFENKNEVRIDSLANLLDKKEDSILYLWIQKYLNPIHYHLILSNDQSAVKEEHKIEYKSLLLNYLRWLYFSIKNLNNEKSEFYVAVSENAKFFKIQNILFLEKQYMIYEEKKTMLRIIRIRERPAATIFEGPYFYEK